MQISFKSVQDVRTINENQFNTSIKEGKINVGGNEYKISWDPNTKDGINISRNRDNNNIFVRFFLAIADFFTCHKTERKIYSEIKRSDGFKQFIKSEIKNPKISTMAQVAVDKTGFKQYTFEQINSWLFNGKKMPDLPASKLGPREAAKFSPKKNFSDVPVIGVGKYTQRIGIHSGGITDLKTQNGEKAAIGDSNNGDLLTGCGFAVAKACVNAAGAELQMELYNKFGVPGVMKTPQYGKDKYSHTEGRGYAITCSAYDMNQG